MTTAYTSVPFDFGEFSPRCLGVTLNLSEDLGRYLSTIAAFVLSDDPDEKRYQFLQDFLEQEQDEGAQFIGVGYGSAFIHELKHYHDYLASPFGCSVMRDHLLLLIQLFSVLTDISTEPVIGIPLQSWRDLSDSLHDVYRKQLPSSHFRRSPSERSVRITEYAEDILHRVQAWHSGPPSMPNFPLTTLQLIEAAAVEVQEEQIATLFGSERLARFCDYLNKVDKEGKYTRVSSIWQKVSENLGGATIPASVRNALTFYALCGKTEAKPDDLEAHPVARFLSLINHIRKRNKVPSEDTILQFLDECSDDNGLPTLRDAMIESAEKNKAYAQIVRDIVRDECEKGDWDFPELLFDAYDSWVAAHDHMVAELLRDPVTYFDPSRYMESGSRWVAAPIYVSTTSTDLFRLDASLLEKMQRRGWTPVWGARAYESEEEGGFALMYHPELGAGAPVFGREMAEALSTWIWLAYSLWSRDILNPANRRVAHAMLEALPPGRKVLQL